MTVSPAKYDQSSRSSDDDLRQIAAAMRAFTMTANHHVGGSLSVTDVLTALCFSGVAYLPPGAAGLADPHSDRVVYSKGHTAAPLYFSHWLNGYLDGLQLEDVLAFGEPGHTLERIPRRHPERGIELTTGSLGTGLSFAVGLGMAARASASRRHLWVVLGDAECGEGQVWEGAQSAVELGLRNVTVIVDANGFGSMRTTKRDTLAGTWRGFGWLAEDVDGHDHAALVEAMRRARESDGPVALVCHTTKGSGLLEPYAGTNRAGGEVSAEYRPPFDVAAEVNAAVLAVRRLHGRHHADEAQAPLPPPSSAAPPALQWDTDRHPIGSAACPKTFAEELCDLIDPGGRMFVLSPDAIRNSGLGPTLERHGNWAWENWNSPISEWRIAEQDAMSAAAGLAAGGRSVAMFLMEGFVWRLLDQLRQSVCASGLPLTLVGTSGGIGDELGPMVQSDTCLSALTNMRELEVVEASDVNEAKALFAWSLRQAGPVYLRLPGDTLRVRASLFDVLARPLEGGAWVEAEQHDPNSPPDAGQRLTLVAAGALLEKALEARDTLWQDGIDASVVNLYSPTQFAAVSTKARDAIIDPHLPAVSIHNAPANVLGQFLPPRTSAAIGLAGYGQWGKPLSRLYELEGLTTERVVDAARDLVSGP